MSAIRIVRYHITLTTSDGQPFFDTTVWVPENPEDPNDNIWSSLFAGSLPPACGDYQGINMFVKPSDPCSARLNIVRS